MTRSGVKKAAVTAALYAVSTLPLLIAGTAMSQSPDEDCKGAGKIKCDQWSECRILKEVNPFAIKETGSKLKATIIEVLGISSEDVTLQTIAESTQNLRTRIISLLGEWNACQISKEEYVNRSSFVYKLEADGDNLNGLIAEVKQLKNLQTTDRQKIETLSRAKQDLKQYVAQIVDFKIDTLKQELMKEQAARSEDIAAKIAVMRKDAKAEAEQFGRELDGRMTALEAEIVQVKIELSNMRRLIDDLVKERYHKTLLVLQGGPYAFDLNNTMRPGVLIGFENYYPQIAAYLGEASVFFEFGHVWWERKDSYPTLANMPPVAISQDNGFSFADVGIKKYFTLTDTVKIYVGALAGYSWEDDWDLQATDWFQGLVAGITLYPGNIKTSLDLRYAPVKIAEKEVRFNPFGDSVESFESSRYRGISIGVVFSLGVW